MEVIHDIVSAKPLDDYKVDVVFDTGEKAVFDCSRYLDNQQERTVCRIQIAETRKRKRFTALRAEC